MKQPAWVSEGSIRKYVRAIAQLTKEGKEVTEAAVKELYVKWGGLVVGESEVTEAAPAEENIAPEEEAVKAKKSSKK